MNKEYHLVIKVSGYANGSAKLTYSITEEDIEVFKDLIKCILENSRNSDNQPSNKYWNWFDRIPDKWDGLTYVDDDWSVEYQFENVFGQKFKSSVIKSFFRRFTPHGADRISDIRVYKCEEIEFLN